METTQSPTGNTKKEFPKGNEVNFSSSLLENSTTGARNIKTSASERERENYDYIQKGRIISRTLSHSLVAARLLCNLTSRDVDARLGKDYGADDTLQMTSWTC